MHIQAATGEIAAAAAGSVITPCFEGAAGLDQDTAAIDRLLGGAISRLIKQGEVKGKANEITLLHSLGKLPAERVLMLGLGKEKDLTTNRVRSAFAEACRYLRQKGVDDIATAALGSGTAGITPEQSGQTLAEGAILGLYTFRTHISKEDNGVGEVKQIRVMTGREVQSRVEDGIARGRVLAEAANLTREMVNEPANYKNPTTMAQQARELGDKYGLAVAVFEREQMQQMGMGALLGVAQGSQQPPRFIVMHYQGRPEDKTIDLALVGKGITFDSGGISLKHAEKMGEMKGDMAGGASVMAAVTAIARFRARINVSAFIPATENMPGGSAFRPADILTAMNGKTIEIITTDAEGRLVLADALSYARKLGPKAIIDVATLTGACTVALGDVCSGAFGNNQPLMDRIVAAANDCGEPVWPMPMLDEYREQIKSNVADVKNSGGPNAGAITAAKFLAEFVDGAPWVHLDIAGTSMTDKERGYIVKGGTGNPVRTLVTVALTMAK